MCFRIVLAGHVVEISWVFRGPLWIPESVLADPLIIQELLSPLGISTLVMMEALLCRLCTSGGYRSCAAIAHRANNWSNQHAVQKESMFVS